MNTPRAVSTDSAKRSNMWALEHALLTRLKGAASLRSLSHITKSVLDGHPLALIENLIAQGLVKRIATGLYIGAKVPFLLVGATECFRNEAFLPALGGMLCNDLAALFGDAMLDRLGLSYFVCTAAGYQVVDRDKGAFVNESSAAIDMSVDQLLKGDNRGAITSLERHANLLMISGVTTDCNSAARNHVVEDTLREILRVSSKALNVGSRRYCGHCQSNMHQAAMGTDQKSNPSSSPPNCCH